MGERHLASAPESAYVGSEQVDTARLDSLWDELRRRRASSSSSTSRASRCTCCAAPSARSAELRGVQAELALAHLYEGDSPWREVVDHLAARGFELAGVEPGFGDPDSGRMLQFDGVFLRS